MLKRIFNPHWRGFWLNTTRFHWLISTCTSIYSVISLSVSRRWGKVENTCSLHSNQQDVLELLTADDMDHINRIHQNLIVHLVKEETIPSTRLDWKLNWSIVLQLFDAYLKLLQSLKNCDKVEEIIQRCYQIICSMENAAVNTQSFLLTRLLPLTSQSKEMILDSILQLVAPGSSNYLFELIQVCEANERTELFEQVKNTLDQYPIQFIKDLLNNATLHSIPSIQQSLRFFFTQFM